jgi:hypothetical protein
MQRMATELDPKYDIVGKSVDILFTVANVQTAHERTVIAVADGMLICVAPDGVTEWIPLGSILTVVDRNNPRNVVRTKSYYGVS